MIMERDIIRDTILQPWSTGPTRLYDKNIKDKFVLSVVDAKIHKMDNKYLSYNPYTYLLSYFNLYSALFVVPFKIVISEEENRIRVIPRKILGKLLCIAIQTCALAYSFGSAFWHISNYFLSTADAWALLTLLSYIFDHTLYILTFFTFWTKWGQIEKLLNKVRILKKQPSSSSTLISFVSHPQFIVIFLYLANMLAGMFSYYRRGILRTLTTHIMDSILPENKVPIAIRSILSYPLYLIFFFFQRMNCVFEILMVAAVLSMMALANQFRREVSEDVTPQKLMTKFAELREIFNLCNGIFGQVFLNYAIETLIYYVNTPAVLTKMSISLDKLYKVVYFVYHCITLVGSSEIHKRVKSTVKDFIYKKKVQEDIGQSDLIKLSILSSEVEDDPVGICCVLFTINYAFLASYLGLLGTYAIFAWQMQVQRAK